MTEEVTAEAEVTTTESVDVSTDIQETEEVSEAKTEESDAEAAEPEKPKVDPKKAERSYKERAARRETKELRDTNNRLLKMLEAREQPQQTANKEPQIEDFESIGDYTKAMYKHLGAEKTPEPAREAGDEPVDPRITEALDDLFTAGSEKYEDFDEVVSSQNVPITKMIRDAILDIDDIDLQTEVSYYLGKNPKEVIALKRLSPIRQVMEIGKLEAKLSAKPVTKRPSAAPKPVTPVSGGKTDTSTITGDEDMKSFIAKRNKQLGR